MKNIAKLTRQSVWENQLKGNLATFEEIRNDSLNDLALLAEDFHHMSLIVESVEQNYSALLEQNQQMKALLLNVVESCYCWQGNRCDRCQNILNILANPPAKRGS
ncbi:hypothetical protein [Phormidium sp. CCY1219]|uniref:hypothetical protein n=1 Tax=Phormidium sp. CCY1219 TaxID=2886104 RepID=UPI002D1F2439|nr:hypothetical protein [Phormidium sp. CCY1219]MEB3831102.1 hypothetical protein [Phormidium sp. CCY1219]